MSYIATLFGVSLCVANGVVHPFLSQHDAKRHPFYTSEAIQTRGPCSAGQFAESQIAFNTAIGIPTSIDWRQAQLLANVTGTVFFRDPQGFTSVCALAELIEQEKERNRLSDKEEEEVNELELFRARQQFVQNLGAAYPNCVNRFYLLEQGSSFINAVSYVHLYKHLEFLCSTGYEVYQYNLPCIKAYQSDPAYVACFTALFSSISTDPNSLCPATQVFLPCIRSFTQSQCGQGVGWVECEKERYGFAYDCHGLVCPAN